MEKNQLMEQYRAYCTKARNLMKQTINYEQDQALAHMFLQLRECFDLPITENSVHFFEHKIETIERYLNEKTQSSKITQEGTSTGYMKVKKTGQAYIPVDDIQTPQFNMVPLHTPSMKGTEFPNYILNDQKMIPVGTTSASNRGISHVWMLAFLTFLFETLFLGLSFFLYQIN